MDNAVDIIKSSGGETVLTKSQTVQLRDYIASLETQAEEAKEYRQQIMDQVRKYALIAIPKVNVKEFLLGCENMTTKQLSALKNGLKAQSEQLFPPEVQLKPAAQTKAANNNAFKI